MEQRLFKFIPPGPKKKQSDYFKEPYPQDKPLYREYYRKYLRILIEYLEKKEKEALR